MTNVAEVDKNQGETNASLIRRFSRRVQGTNALKIARGLRFYQRPASELRRKKRALKRLERQRYYERMRKLGKIK